MSVDDFDEMKQREPVLGAALEEVFRRLAELAPVQMQISAVELMQLIGAVQLAARHPAAGECPPLKVALEVSRQMGAHLVGQLPDSCRWALEELLKRGELATYDVASAKSSAA